MFVAVGDIHGHFSQFCDLMQKLNDKISYYTPIIFLGDYVDGGADTAKVIKSLRIYEEYYPHWVFLKGNHEDMMTDALLHDSARYNNYMNWYMQGGAETFASYAPAYVKKLHSRINPFIIRTLIGDDDLNWLDKLPTLHETDEAIFVHGGLTNNVPSETTELNRLWIRDSFIKSEYDWGKKVFFGHTPFDEPLVLPNKVGIDTMRHDFGKLTAAIVEGDDIEFVHSYST